MRLWCGRQRGAGSLQLLLRGHQIGQIKQRDTEIYARQSQSRLELQRTLESIRRFFVLKLFEQRNADVIRAIGFFAVVCSRLYCLTIRCGC